MIAFYWRSLSFLGDELSTWLGERDRLFTSGARFIFGFESAGVEGGHGKCLVMPRASEVAESDFEVPEQCQGLWALLSWDGAVGTGSRVSSRVSFSTTDIVWWWTSSAPIFMLMNVGDTGKL